MSIPTPVYLVFTLGPDEFIEAAQLHAGGHTDPTQGPVIYLGRLDEHARKGLEEHLFGSVLHRAAGVTTFDADRYTAVCAWYESCIWIHGPADLAFASGELPDRLAEFIDQMVRIETRLHAHA